MRTGRPRKPVDKDQFEKLCNIQCSREEIAAWFDIDETTLEKWCKETYKESFSLVYAKKRGIGRISLRRSQFKMAERNPTMAIWMGKQYLGQTDKQDVTVARNDDETIREMENYFANKQKADS